MDAEKCRIILKVIALGSMSAAAEELGYTPGGISYILDTVESELDLKLVKRSRSGVTLTQSGKKLFPYLKAYVKAEEDIFTKAASFREDISGQITIGTFPSIGRLILPDLIQKFRAMYPNVTIKTFEGITEELEKVLIQNDVDFCISSSRPKNFEWIPLREDALVCILSSEHPLATKTAVSVEDLKHEKFILSDYGRDSNVNQFLAQSGIEPNVVCYTQENASAYALVRRNIGITVVNELATIDQAVGVEIRPLDPPAAIREGIVIRSMGDAPQIVRQFIRFIQPLIPPDNSTLRS